MAIQGAFTLNPNEIFASLANMIISQEVFADNLGKHQTLVDKARVDGSLYGDKKLYYATDVLESKRLIRLSILVVPSNTRTPFRLTTISTLILMIPNTARAIFSFTISLIIYLHLLR